MMIETYSTNVDAIVQRYNRLWLFGGDEIFTGSFEGACSKARGYAHRYKGEMIIVRFPKHLDDPVEHYSSFYVLIRK